MSGRAARGQLGPSQVKRMSGGILSPLTVAERQWYRARAFACGWLRLSRRVHRARRKAEQALARTCVATGGTHTPAPTSAVCAACGISQWRVMRGGGRIA